MSDVPRYQALLDELNQLDWSSLFQDSILEKERRAYIRLGKQRIRHVKGLIRQEKGLIKARYDNRVKGETQKEQIALLPYLAVDTLISKLELSIAELESAIDTNMSLPTPYLPGDYLVEERTADSISWRITTKAQWLREIELQEKERKEAIERHKQEVRQLITAKRYIEAKALLEEMLEDGVDTEATAWLERLNQILANQRITERKWEIQPNPPSPTTERVSRRQRIAHEREQYKIVCPNCENQTSQSVSLTLPSNELQCPTCQSYFSTTFYRIRASRSTGYGGYSREFNVRVYNPAGAEQLLTFNTPGIQVELRSKDLTAFTYMNENLVIIQNFTIKAYTRVWYKPAESRFTLRTWMLLILVLAVVFIYVAIMIQRT